MERKLATVLFVDLVDSTGLVTGADPEVVRRRVQTFFDRVSHCVMTHGGIVEKFAGDAVMAAFGIPQAHEDDAERAVRAGLAILDALEELELEARIGVESGEIVTEDGEATFATGEAVNLAARLEQAAEPGQLVLGPGAHRLTLGRIEVEDLGPVELKGIAQPVWAWRALGTNGSGGGRPRSMQAPLVGRDAELDLLQNTYQRALRDRRAHLFTVYGEPGVGKSRLAREFADALEGATVLPGRSLPYGEGVTYWPLAEMVKCAAGLADDDPLDVAIEKLRAFCEVEALQRDESEELVEALLDGGELTEQARQALLDKTEGNPLFVEETMRMVAEEGAESVERIPDTVQALIAARIDRVPTESKSLLQRAAVIGRVFWLSALERLSPELESIEEPLEDLLLRDFVVDEPRSTIRGEQAYRFKHVLIREVAYASVSKSARAEHHQAFAAWLKERAGEELFEIRAYHLDHAAKLTAELTGSVPVDLQREAAEALAEAGLRAFAREANRTARHLFVRSVELEPTLRRRYLAARAADRLSDLPAVSREMEEVLAAAVGEGDRWTQGRALVTLGEAVLLRNADVQAAEQMIDQALQVFEPDDLTGRFRALRAQSSIAWAHGDLEKEERLML